MDTTTTEKAPRNYKFNEGDKKYFNCWWNKNVTYNPTKMLELSELYKSYEIYTGTDKQVVPLSKRKFSNLLKTKLINDLETTKVRLEIKSKVYYQGLDMKVFSSKQELTRVL